jgi:hypothetical protein
MVALLPLGRAELIVLLRTVFRTMKTIDIFLRCIQLTSKWQIIIVLTSNDYLGPIVRIFRVSGCETIPELSRR